MGNWYPKLKCYLCGKIVKGNGLAQFSHKAWHVNRKELLYVYELSHRDGEAGREVFLTPDQFEQMRPANKLMLMKCWYKPKSIRVYFDPRDGSYEDLRAKK